MDFWHEKSKIRLFWQFANITCACDIWHFRVIACFMAEYSFLELEMSDDLKGFSHYSKSQIFVQKFNFDKTPTFSRFSPKIFLTIFFVKSKLSTAKKSKTPTFSRVFHPQKSIIFSKNQNWNFRQKNEDFEQCVNIYL